MIVKGESSIDEEIKQLEYEYERLDPQNAWKLRARKEAILAGDNPMHYIASLEWEINQLIEKGNHALNPTEG